MPSPHMSVVAPAELSDSTISSFCFGATRANTATCALDRVAAPAPRSTHFRGDNAAYAHWLPREAPVAASASAVALRQQRAARWAAAWGPHIRVRRRRRLPPLFEPELLRFRQQLPYRRLL